MAVQAAKKVSRILSPRGRRQKRGAMIAYRLTGKERLERVQVPLPELEEHEVLVRLRVCGICASEYFPWKTGSQTGKIFGHEGVGIVEKIGRKVTGFCEGDRVTGMMYEAFAEYTKVPENCLVKVPSGLSDEEAVGEPLACMMSGVLRTPIVPGGTFAVVGTGYMGLGFMQMMRAKGAAKIIAVDARPEGLHNAEKFGADETYFPNEVPEDYLVDRWDDTIFLRGIPTVAEASGSQPGLELAGKMTAVHGNLSIVGYHQGGTRTVDMELWNWKAITVVNAHERRMELCAGYIRDALALAEKGMLNTKEMITHRYSLDEVNQAFREFKEKPEGYIKGLIRIGYR